jgi:hypothetical protein
VGVDEDLMVDPALFLWAPAKENDNPLIRKVQHLYWALPYSMLFALWRIDSLKVSATCASHTRLSNCFLAFLFRFRPFVRNITR